MENMLPKVRRKKGIVRNASRDFARSDAARFSFDCGASFAKKGAGRAIATTNRPIVRCAARSEEHTSELQSRLHLVCRLLLEKKKSSRCIQGGGNRPTTAFYPRRSHE